MSLGEVNKGAIALILVLLLGAGGYLWYSQMYKPAVAEKAAAEAAAQQAEATLTAARDALEQAQRGIEDAKSEAAKPDTSVAVLAKARTAIPPKDLIDDATIALVELAERSGVQTNFKAGDTGSAGAAFDSTAGGSLQGATPVDLEFEAAGTYAEMMQFMSLVEASAEEKDGKLYTRGRLFNVVRLEIGSEDDNGSSGGFEEEGGGLTLGPNDIRFTVVVRMYTSSTENAQNVGATTPDPAAAATEPAAGGTGTGTGTGTGLDPATGQPAAGGTDPAAAGGAGTGPGTGTDPATGQPAAGGTDPAAAGGTGAGTGTGTGAPATTGGI